MMPDGFLAPLLFWVAVLVFNLIPIIVAFSRRHRRRIAILLVDLLLGWTLIGWVVALVWALTNNVEPRDITRVDPTHGAVAIHLGDGAVPAEAGNSTMIDVATFKKAHRGYYFRAGPTGIACNLPPQLFLLKGGGPLEFPWSQVGEITHSVHYVSFKRTADQIIIYPKSGWVALCYLNQSAVVEPLPDVIGALERFRAQSPENIV